MPQQHIAWIANTMQDRSPNCPSPMSAECVEAARAFHATLPGYAPTPLVGLAAMAAHLGIGSLHVKDESARFGLNAFKSLGVSFAIASHVAAATGRPIADCGFDYLSSAQCADELGQTTFYAATDGNHGRGLAWAARQLGQRAVVRMPKGSTAARCNAIAAEGAEVSIEELNYDECVRLAARQAAETGGVLVQDTAWEGYEQIPSWIMQGYGTLSSEAADQLEDVGAGCPTHIILQAGVGSFASSVAAYFANRYPSCPPRIVVVEASAADCLYQSARADDGNPHAAGGELKTIMAGLACGEPSTIAWDILRTLTDAFLSCSDYVAELGMRMLAAPLGGDPAIVSGESGAVGMGALALIMGDPAYAELRELLGLDPDSRVLLVSTEGDTDPERYRSIVGSSSQA